MKRRILSASLALLLFLSLTLSLCGCSGYLRKKGSGTIANYEETLSAGDYSLVISNISLANIDRVNLRVVPGGGTPSVKVSTDDNILDLIRVSVDNDRKTIQISGDKRYIFKATAFLINIEADVTAVTLNGGMEAEIELTGERLSLTVDGAYTGNVSLTAETVAELTVNGASKLDVSGRSDRFLATVNGAAKISAFDLISRAVDVSVNGAGKAEVWAEEELTAEINGVGQIVYKGEPEKVSPSVNGLGTVNAYSPEKKDD